MACFQRGTPKRSHKCHTFFPVQPILLWGLGARARAALGPTCCAWTTVYTARHGPCTVPPPLPSTRRGKPPPINQALHVSWFALVPRRGTTMDRGRGTPLQQTEEENNARGKGMAHAGGRCLPSMAWRKQKREIEREPTILLDKMWPKPPGLLQPLPLHQTEHGLKRVLEVRSNSDGECSVLLATERLRFRILEYKKLEFYPLSYSNSLPALLLRCCFFCVQLALLWVRSR